MDITIDRSSVPHRDPDESQAFRTEVLGVEVRSDDDDEPGRNRASR